MSDYKHGAYGDQQAIGSRVAAESQSAVVLVGTAPVQNLLPDSDGNWPVNKPVLIHDISEAKKIFGYSDDWTKYTLCEAMHVFLELNGVGPLVLINVLDPKSTHKASTATSKSLTPSSGRITIASAEDIILDTITVKTQATPPVEKVKGTDYTATYNASKKTIIIQELTAGALGNSALTVEYYLVTASSVADTDVIGATDNLGTNTGLYAIKSVYNECGVIPSILMAPGWSEMPSVHAVMGQVSLKVNGHWDAWMFTDIPLSDNGTAITLTTAKTWKDANGYTKKNETVSFPMVVGTDGKKYRYSIKDRYIFRSSNTILLRAEAKLRKGDKNGAAADINIIRDRAECEVKATPAMMTIQFILDERARELYLEELRLLTLLRMGQDGINSLNAHGMGIAPQTYYSLDGKTPVYPPSFAPIKGTLLPYPQSVIDGNTGAIIEQNPGWESAPAQQQQ